MAVPFPVLAPITSTVLFWIPPKEIFHLVRYPNRQSAITGLGVTHFVPFPVLGYAISGTVIHWAPYRNWALCVWSHFRYGALPVPVRSFTGPRTKNGLYACGPISGTGALTVPGRSFTGSRTETGFYARWVRLLVGCGPMATARRRRRHDDGDDAKGDDDDDDGDGATRCDNEDDGDGWSAASLSHCS